MTANSDVFKWIMPSIKNRSLKEVPNDESVFNFRIEMARQQNQLPTVDREKIIEYVSLPASMFGNGTFFLLRANGESILALEI